MRICFIIFVILSWIVGCKDAGKKDGSTIIHIDLKKTRMVELHGDYAKQIYLTAHGSPVLMDVVKKMMLVDGQYIVRSTNNLWAFDAATGVLRTAFSQKGKAQGEYITLWDAWVEGDTVCMFDLGSKKILRYSLAGKLYSVDPVRGEGNGPSFQFLAKAGDGYYVGKRSYYGKGGDTELILYDKNYKFVKEFGDFVIESGINLGYPFFVNSSKEILYFRYLQNDIYAIDDEQNVTVKYTVDFGDNNVPFDLHFKDEYERIDFVNKNEEKYATFVSNIYESDKYFCFKFVCMHGKCLGVYDKSSGEAASFMFDYVSELYSTDVYVLDNKAILVTQDMEEMCLTVIGVDDMMKMH